MKKRMLMSFLMLFALALGFVSCSDNDTPGTSTAPITVKLAMPMDVSDAALTDATVRFTNVQTGAVYTTTRMTKAGSIYEAAFPELPQGSYNVQVIGKISYEVGGKTVSSSVKAAQNGVVVSASNAANAVNLNLFTTTGSEGFVISEIFFSGTLTPEGKKYFSDQYLKITNNSDETLYADSLLIVESAFTNSLKNDYTPNIIDQAMTVDAIYMIPGNGKQVAVQPGKSLLIAVNGKNHKEANANSYDLSKADFEFYDESTNTITDEENATVPNLDKWYCYTKSIFTLFSSGAKSYAIAKIQGTKEAFLQNNFYKPYYMNEFVTPAKKMEEEAYFLPNAWIIDAVNLGMKNKYVWNVIAATLDKGFTYCGDDMKDNARFGTSVIRKMEGGKYVDTNNSSEDFLPKSVPSVK